MSNRDKLRPASSKTLREQAQEEEKYVNRGGSDGHKLQGGINRIRIYPVHPGEKSFMVMNAHHWGTVEGDDGPAKRKVSNAVIHGGLSADPIEAYIALCQQKLDGANAEQADILAKLTNSQKGLTKKTKWEIYADMIVDGKPMFDFMEITKTLRDFIQKESMSDDPEEPIEVDPFTDPDEGRCLVVDYNSGAKRAKDYYKSVKISKNPTALTDEQVDNFLEKVTPLAKRPSMQYTKKHFETALEIVKYFDEENDVNLFESEEFQATIKALQAELAKRGAGASTTVVKAKAKKADDDDEDDAPPAKTVKKKAPVDDDEDEAPKPKKKPAPVEEEDDEPPAKPAKKKSDKFDAMDRDELKEYIAEHELEVTVKKIHTDDEIRANIRAAETPAKKAPVEEEDDEPVVNTKKAKKVEPDEDEDDTPVVKKKNPKLDDVKKMLRGGDDD